jgi:polynucleotide 5'-hydroxyl-kinase GRC3/NOL9
LLSVLRDRPGLTIHCLEVAPFARVRTPPERARYRADRFASYFAKAKTLPLDANRLTILSSPVGHSRLKREKLSPLLTPGMLREEGFAGVLVGLNDAANETLGVGLFQGLSQDAKEIRVLTPMEEASGVRILQMGSIRLNRSGEGV